MTQAQVESELRTLKIADLVFDDQNPRRDVGDIGELTASIRSFGVLEPIVVRPSNGHFGVIAGRRRWAAARDAGLTEIPAMVTGLSDEDAAAASLIENLQRKDLNALEEARGYKAWLDLTKRSQADLAKAVGKHASTIANALRVLDAAAPVQKALENGSITLAHAKVVMTLPENALSLVDLKAGVSVRELEEQSRKAQRAYTSIERIKATVEKAKAAGKVVTWRTGPNHELYVGGVEIDIVKALGDPPKKIVGELRYGGYGSPDKKTHDVVCDCNAVAVLRDDGTLEPVCVSPSGWKKAEERARKNMGRATPAKKKAVKTAEQKRKEAERDTKAAIAEASDALDFKKLRAYHPLKTNVPAGFLKGGIGSEPARLALFGYVIEHSSGDNKSKTWEVELWKRIAKLPLSDVRERVTKWAVAAGLDRIRDTNRNKAYGTKGTPLGTNNATVITQLVNTHYGVRATKAAKR